MSYSDEKSCEGTAVDCCCASRHVPFFLTNTWLHRRSANNPVPVGLRKCLSIARLKRSHLTLDLVAEGGGSALLRLEMS